ncbi:MAG TPA: DUF222 domain-containing protein [Actinomycetota bacterium]
MLRTAVRAQVNDMMAALQRADKLIASAVETLGRLMPSGEIERATGLPAELAVALGAHRPGSDARALCQAASVLRGMPSAARAFARGELSWPTVRIFIDELRRVDGAGRERIDRVIEHELARGAEPEMLIDRVRDEVTRLRSDLIVAREDREIEHSFLSIQPRLDGQGGSLYAEADTEAFATICEAIDTAAPRPIGPDALDDPRSRARQRLDGLVAVCEAALGGTSQRRPRPRFLVTLDARDLDDDEDPIARVLWRARGTSGRLSRVAVETLLCDAEVQPIIFDGARPITVGDVQGDPSPRARAALLARDGRCRFPGCSMPAAWTDVHHIKGRGPQTCGIDELVLLCRRCHRRVHRHRWRIEPQDDGTIAFRHRGRTLISSPRAPTRE